MSDQKYHEDRLEYHSVLEDRYLNYSSDIKKLHQNKEALQRVSNMPFDEKELQLSIIMESVNERINIQEQIVAEMKDIREDLADYLTETGIPKIQITLPSGEPLGAWIQDGVVAISNYQEPINPEP